MPELFHLGSVREILDDVLEKHAMDVETQFTFPEVLKIAHWRQGNVAEICPKFKGMDESERQ